MRFELRIVTVVMCLSLLSAASPVLASSVTEASLPTIAASHETYPYYEIDGVMLSNGSIRVLVTDLDGVTIFESHYPVAKADGRYLEWEYRMEHPVSRSTHLKEGTVPTLAAMTQAARDIVRMIRRGDRPESPVHATSDLEVHIEDNYGCDSPADGVSCTSAGNCCDRHDACYFFNQCEATSWTGYTSAACLECNVVAAACITFGYGSTGQPSGCCLAGNCGQPRPPDGGDFFGFGGVDYPFDGVLGNDGPFGPLTGPPDWDAQSPGGGGGGGGWTTITTGGTTISVGGGWCRFPNGAVIPCG